MPITPVNLSKHLIIPSNTGATKTLVMWADTVITWADPLGLWGSGYKALSTRAKNIITPTNRAKS